ncbi:MAG: tRNA (adenosine(37)-N6)-threonylcarbamoyltransferase complex ATPase subunit type 1 TsaE [Bacteroidetes bacterium]|nr:MAG: tRNA (adenosine(37)-N6)-threonylcarbamoyltransferase complex ATPase subunit type 1 TsaE [Bacteroidota bacterium]
MIEQELNNVTLDSLPDAAKQIIAMAQDYKLWAFYGEMGAGKTTLIKAICKELRVNQAISSPTFSLVNEYKSTDNQTIYHFDFYRIKSIEEVYDIGYEDYFYSGNLCLIEWPEKVEELLKVETIFKIFLSKTNSNQRTLQLSIL